MKGGTVQKCENPWKSDNKTHCVIILSTNNSKRRHTIDNPKGVKIKEDNLLLTIHSCNYSNSFSMSSNYTTFIHVHCLLILICIGSNITVHKSKIHHSCPLIQSAKCVLPCSKKWWCKSFLDNEERMRIANCPVVFFLFVILAFVMKHKCKDQNKQNKSAE